MHTPTYTYIGISLPYPSFCRTEDSRNFCITQAFLRRESFPRIRSPPERSLRCCCLSVSAKISLRQRRRVRRRIYPSWSEHRAEEAAYQEEADTVRSATFPFLPLSLPPEGLQCLSGASSSRRDATRARNARYRTETWYIFDRSGEASHHCTVLSITPSPQSDVLDRHDDTISLICRASPCSGYILTPSANQSNDCRHSRPGDGSCFPSPISREQISTAHKSHRLQITPRRRSVEIVAVFPLV